MDVLVRSFPQESVIFFKRVIQMTVITGISLVIPTASCIYATWNSPDGSDRSLRYWSVFRVLIFLVQLPLRYRIWSMLHEAQQYSNSNSFEISDKLTAILKTKEWKLTQYFSGLLSTWVFVTLAMTVTMETNFPTETTQDLEDAAFACYKGYLSPCLYRLCWVSIGILCVHVAFVFLWLRSVLETNTLIRITPLQIRQVSTIIKFDETDPFHKDHFDQCSICLELYKNKDKIRIFNHCNHNFHKQCIDEWLNEQARCPLCNHKILDGLQSIMQTIENNTQNRMMIQYNNNHNNDINNQSNHNNSNDNNTFIDDRLNSDDDNDNDNENESKIIENDNNNNEMICLSSNPSYNRARSNNDNTHDNHSRPPPLQPTRTPPSLQATWEYLCLSQN